MYVCFRQIEEEIGQGKLEFTCLQLNCEEMYPINILQVPILVCYVICLLSGVHKVPWKVHVAVFYQCIEGCFKDVFINLIYRKYAKLQCSTTCWGVSSVRRFRQLDWRTWCSARSVTSVQSCLMRMTNCSAVRIRSVWRIHVACVRSQITSHCGVRR